MIIKDDIDQIKKGKYKIHNKKQDIDKIKKGKYKIIKNKRSVLTEQKSLTVDSNRGRISCENNNDRLIYK